MSLSQRLANLIDNYICIKNGYIFFTHLVPFAIAALLLLILTLPTEDLLSKLDSSLQSPNSRIWIPAILLTFISTTIYFAMMYEQIRNCYLWENANLRRTLITSLLYILITTSLALYVLSSLITRSLTFGDVWASYLLAILSLTGIGWKTPSSLVNSIGIKSPEYSEAHLAVNEVTHILNDVRSKPRGEIKDVNKIHKTVNSLSEIIKSNKELEPIWAKQRVECANDLLITFNNELEKKFVKDTSNIDDFADACNCKNKSLYGEYISALISLGDYWEEWQCSV